jgi:type 1 glutamine amidotransferase
MKWFCIPLLFLFSTLATYSNDPKPKVTFLIAEREYLSEETLPRFAKSHLSEDYHIQYCQADKEGNGRHILRNSQEIIGSDLLFISVRRRAFNKNVMNMIRLHIKKGKPVIGIRTASHAFQLRKETLPVGHEEWTNWDQEIIGGNYNGHLGKGLTCQIYQTSKVLSHEILDEVKLPFSSPATLYRNSPLPKTSIALLTGEVNGHPPEPVAWINKTTAGGKVFYTSLGHVDDFKNPAIHQLLKNGIKWCLTRD